VTLSVEVLDLVHCYGASRAVDGLNLSVRAGECFGLLGPNGAGKTTTLEILEGLLIPTSGTVKLLGRDWAHDRALLSRKIGVAPQETRLEDRQSVEETLRLFHSFYDRGPSVEELLESMQLTEKRRCWVMHLSGGQRQRLGIACAMVGAPEVLFLDEPSTGLDPQSRRAIWNLIASYKERGTVMLTTHYMDEAERLCDRVAIVDRGRVVTTGTPAELVRSLGGDQMIELETAPVLPEELFSGVSGVHSVGRLGDILVLAVVEAHSVIPAILARVSNQDARMVRLSTRSATLEDVFVSLTGRSLRED
jgi:ABC-2 type transport system ATP-binding protein